jgi:hypothetical protein
VEQFPRELLTSLESSTHCVTCHGISGTLSLLSQLTRETIGIILRGYTDFSFQALWEEHDFWIHYDGDGCNREKAIIDRIIKMAFFCESMDIFFE